MSAPLHIDLDRRLDGARILWRHFLSATAPRDGYVREFSVDGQFVRISTTDKKSDAGSWHRCYELRVESILEAARAPQPESVKPARGVAGEKDEVAE